MMEEREKYEWRLREEQIKEIQNARLDVLKEMLEDRETKQNEVIEGSEIQSILNLLSVITKNHNLWLKSALIEAKKNMQNRQMEKSTKYEKHILWSWDKWMNSMPN